MSPRRCIPFEGGILCTRGPRVPRCSVDACDWPAYLLCDHPVPSKKSGTCDRRLCEHHARTVGVDRHYCLQHARQQPLPFQGPP